MPFRGAFSLELYPNFGHNEDESATRGRILYLINCLFAPAARVKTLFALDVGHHPTKRYNRTCFVIFEEVDEGDKRKYIAQYRTVSFCGRERNRKGQHDWSSPARRATLFLSVLFPNKLIVGGFQSCFVHCPGLCISLTRLRRQC
jgi:hypothetical protein